MVADATTVPDDMINSENVCELKAPDASIEQLILKGPTRNGSADLAKTIGGDALDFSIKPNFCLNMVSGPVDYKKSGAIRIRLFSLYSIWIQ